MEDETIRSEDSGRGESLLSSSPSPPTAPLVGSAGGEGEGRGELGGLDFPTPPLAYRHRKKHALGLTKDHLLTLSGRLTSKKAD